jgi:hypothetical protein
MGRIVLITMSICWPLAYVLIIRRAYLDKATGMPFPAFFFNLSWEGMMLFVLPVGSLTWFAVLVTFLLDWPIVIQYFIYDRPRRAVTLKGRLFWPISLAMLVVALGTTVIVTVVLEDHAGGVSAYAMNALMSVFFCKMLVDRDGLRGQSLYIAVSKAIGSAATLPTIKPHEVLLWWFGGMMLAFDVAYIVMVWIVGRRDGVDLLKRV